MGLRIPRSRFDSSWAHKNMNLSTPLEEIFRLLPKQKLGLKKLKLITAGDLIDHFPARYENPGDLKRIDEIITGETVRIWGRVKKIDYEKTWKTKMAIAQATVEDQTGSIKLIWFRQPYIAKMIPVGSSAIFSGKVANRRGEYYLANPNYEIIPSNVIPNFTRNMETSLIPIYPSAAGVSSLWIEKAVKKILPHLQIPEFLPKNIVEKYHLPLRDVAARVMHNPKNISHTEAARKRFAFEEVFLIQLSRMKEKEEIKKTSGINFDNLENLKSEFIKLLSFSPTAAQMKAMSDVKKDLESGHPMNRLLEGDVGSGKTAVAASAAFMVAKNRMQATYMAPTEILARQHFDGFWKLLKNTGIKIGLLTSSISEKFPSKVNPNGPTHASKAQLLKWAREGEIQILIGTHSLIEKKVAFKNLALAMVDEQHRFGVKQRSKLLRKNKSTPHFLTMTATPIPRTLALSIYADLDVTVLDELPPGRKSIETKVVPPKDRALAYEFIRQKLARGEQAFVICPKINPKDDAKDDIFKLDLKSVKEEYKKLKEKIFPEFEIGLMHGKLTPKEKEEAMGDFRDGKTNILVSTSVIEVGVDVPNATIMIIEGAERFGLAQLHQFRGRVGRGKAQSYCFIFPSSYSENINKRLKALREAKSGFELAEYDLEFRGPGELAGGKQSGISDIGMEALRNIKMVEAARAEAKNIIETNSISKYPLLEEKINKLQSEPLHFE